MNTELSLLDINTLNESLRMIEISLEKSLKHGVFDMNEAYLLKLSQDHLKNCVATQLKYQEYFVSQSAKVNTPVLQESNRLSPILEADDIITVVPHNLKETKDEESLQEDDI